MYKLAITGGIGSGKTTVSNFINDNYDSVYLFNADKESKSHLKSSLSIQHKIINVFGPSVTVNNKLDIKKLAEVAFSDKINQDILNGIMWAEVFILINNKIEECQKNKISLFIVDAAMIFEAKLNNFFDSTLLVTAKKEIRLKRAEKRHNISLEQIKNRMSLQLKEKEKEKLADYMIQNNEDLDTLYKNIKDFYNTILPS
ncbi:MAG: dephospho-CoA kinase [Candidatus Marinimicrobia bacterium]|nr:dephospho-CoA kinase [Candidatus Neomarinimicrobiota bacterium]